MLECYARLAERYARSIDWRRVTVAQMDEYVGAPEAMLARDSCSIGSSRHSASNAPCSSRHHGRRRARDRTAAVATTIDLVIHGSA